jgi:hypothetical protein
MFNQLRKSSRALTKQIVQLVYFMRGALQYHDALMLTPGERDLMEEFISERLEMEGKKIHPNY